MSTRIALLFTFLIFNATLANAAPFPWSDLLTGQTLKLAQDIVVPSHLPQPLVVTKGTPFTLVSITPLDEISVINYEMSFGPCSSTYQGQSDEVFIVNELYGFSLSPHCVFNVFIEPKDLSLPSVFE